MLTSDQFYIPAQTTTYIPDSELSDTDIDEDEYEFKVSEYEKYDSYIFNAVYLIIFAIMLQLWYNYCINMVNIMIEHHKNCVIDIIKNFSILNDQKHQETINTLENFIYDIVLPSKYICI